ncbi:MAG: transcription termination/antitermination protein NusG [Faecalibacterium sp.]|jgi:transcriptional antiterminator NusG|nr:transcription termination/antitermination protein NusG [Faecalibacterium sp.]
MEEQSQEAQWYVVHTYSGYENKVAQDLQTMVENRHMQDMIPDIKVPTEMVPEIKDGQEKMVERKLFPGYVLVKMIMTDDTWYIVRNTRGCTGFVGPASKPVPLSAEEVENLGVETQAPLSVDFKVGDSVQITSGPMEGFMGTVEEIDLAAFKVRLKVNMFGRETPAELEIGQVSLL